MAPLKLPQLRHESSLLASLLRECASTTANSVLQKDQAQKALLLCEAVARGASLLRRDLHDDDLHDLLEQCESSARLHFSSSNRALHMRKTGQLLRAVEWGEIQTSRFKPNALSGISAACAEAFDVALACGDVRALALQASRARTRCLSLSRSSFSSLSPRTSSLSPVTFPASARSTLSSWVSADVAFELCRRADDNATDPSVSSLSSLTHLAYQARARLAFLCGGVPPASLPLDSIRSLAERAGALFTRRAERAVLLGELADAARRARLFWRALASPVHTPQPLAQQLQQLRDAISTTRDDRRSASRAHTDVSSFNVLCANLGTTRELSRVAEVFTLADRAHASVVMLQETRLPSLAQVPALPRGWVCFVAGRKERASKGGGVALAVRQPFLGCADEKITTVADGLEVVWARVRVNAAREQWFFCASVYVPPTPLAGAEQKRNFASVCDAFVEKTRALVQQGELVVVGGDFNAHLRSDARNERELLLQRLVCDSGLCVANAFPAPLSSHHQNNEPPAMPVRALKHSPRADQLDEIAQQCPITHLQAGVGSEQRAAPAPSKIDWLLVSPQFAACVNSFESVMRGASGHAILTLDANITSLEQRFHTKNRPRLRVELLSRQHLTNTATRRLQNSPAHALADVLAAAAAAADATAAPGGNQAAAAPPSRPSPPLTIVLNRQIQQEFAARNSAGTGVVNASSAQEAYSLFHSVVQGVATKLLTPLAQQHRGDAAPALAKNSGVTYVWWTDELKELQKEKLRAGRKYATQLHKNERLRAAHGGALADDVLAITETLRKVLRECERKFEQAANTSKKHSFARLLEHFDHTIDADKCFPDTLWSMLRAIQRKKASPNGTDALIAVEPQEALLFWKKVWADPLCDDEKIALANIYHQYSELEAVRDSLSSWIRSPSPSRYAKLSAPFTADELLASAKELSAGKAAGFDQLTNDVLRVLSCEALDEFAQVCNRAVTEMCLPEEWLRGSLKLLPKPNTAGTQPGDYRPICLLSCAFKLFEAVLMRRFRAWCDYYDQCDDNFHTPFLSPVQGGFRAKRGTLDQVLHLLLVQQQFSTQVAHGAPHNNGVIAVFLDITKAFDSVPHGICS